MSLFTLKSLLATEDQIIRNYKLNSKCFLTDSKFSTTEESFGLDSFFLFTAHMVSPSLYQLPLLAVPLPLGHQLQLLRGLLWQSSLLGCGSRSKAPASSTRLNSCTHPEGCSEAEHETTNFVLHTKMSLHFSPPQNYVHIFQKNTVSFLWCSSLPALNLI